MTCTEVTHLSRQDAALQWHVSSQALVSVLCEHTGREPGRSMCDGQERFSPGEIWTCQNRKGNILRLVQVHSGAAKWNPSSMKHYFTNVFLMKL